MTSGHTNKFIWGAASAFAVLALAGCTGQQSTNTPRAQGGAGDPARLPGTSDAGRRTLKVGFLPVTCHLTCPVTDFAT